MQDLTIICVGKLKERFYQQAADEYVKRLGAWCRVTVRELPEAYRPEKPSPAQTAAALKKEAEAIAAAVPSGARVFALCIEGKELSSEELARKLDEAASGGVSKLCFVIGGSDGMDEAVKKAADERISMSRMTFPHHLARIMLLEQLYRAFSINAGSRYHK